MVRKLNACSLLFFIMTFRCLLASGENEKTILETLSEKEKATLNELSPADRRHAIGCLSTHNLDTRYGWSALREGEYFAASHNIKVDQVVDEQNFLGFGSSVWVEGVSTKGVADEDVLGVRGVLFMCVGNKKYNTAIGGSRTVMHIVRVNPDNTLEILKPIAEDRGLRVWGEGTGNLVLAEFVRANSRELTIKLWDGKRKTIPMKSVGPVDAAWIESEQKQ
jgi:hypothetical protein